MNSSSEEKKGEIIEKMRQPFYTIEISPISFQNISTISPKNESKDLVYPKAVEDSFMKSTSTEESDNQNNTHNNLSSSDFNMRIAFITKVYGLLITQMLLTIAISSLSFIDKCSEWFMNNQWIIFVGVGLMFLTFLPLCCMKHTARKVPNNYILMILMTAGTSILLTFLCAKYNHFNVLLAWGSTILMVVSLVIYSFFVKSTYNSLIAMIFLLICSMLIISIFSWVIQDKYLEIFYSVLGSLLYGLFLIFDTKLMIGDNAIKYKTDDYILACISLYFDIILIFLYAISAAGAGPGARN